MTNPTPQPPAPMPNVSETPRTDAKVVLCNYGVYRVEADFARQLERELAAVTKERDEALLALKTAQFSNRRIDSQLTAALARAEKAEEALRPLAAIADAWDANKLDDEARKHYGVNLEFTNMKNPDEIELYTGRGGKRLLTLADCLVARAALTTGEKTMSTVEEKAPRNPDWIIDGLGINPDGGIIIRDPRIPCDRYRTISRHEIFRLAEDNERLKHALEDAQQRINAREPARFLPVVISVFEARHREAASLVSVGGVAGGIMSGQRQAYADAAATLREFITPEKR